MNHLSNNGWDLVMRAAGFQAESTQEGLSWWAWLIIIGLILLIVWWLISRQAKTSPPVELPKHEPAPAPDLSARIPEPVQIYSAATLQSSSAISVKPDDLTIIEGIGPKINGVLQTAGISTFANLAVTDVSHLQEILLAAGYRINDPATWPEQARLAAAGDWDGLEKLQITLKAGRKTD